MVIRIVTGTVILFKSSTIFINIFKSHFIVLAIWVDGNSVADPVKITILALMGLPAVSKIKTEWEPEIPPAP